MSQLPNITFEVKGRTHLGKNDCQVQLVGNFYYELLESEGKLTSAMSTELCANQHEIIAARVNKERKERLKIFYDEKAKTEKDKEEKEEDVDMETHTYDILVAYNCSGPLEYSKDGVTIREIFIGHGRRAKKGDRVSIHFLGKLDPLKRKTFDRTSMRNPHQFTLGTKKILKGINIAVTGMTLHGKREAIIPPNLGFGRAGFRESMVPPDATLYYDIELVELMPKKEYDKMRKLEVDEDKERAKYKSDKKAKLPNIGKVALKEL